MKKIVLIIAAILLTIGAFAQKAEWGIKAGINGAAEVTGEGSTDLRMGLYAGILAEFTVNNIVGIQPELVYSMQGATTKIGNRTYTDKFDYVNLPVMLKLYVWERRLSIDGGPQFGYMVSAKETDTDIYDKIDNKFDVAIGLGASFKFGGKFDVSVRYNAGMIKIMDSTTMEHKNGVVQMGLSMKF
jgi:hypothetical protein